MSEACATRPGEVSTRYLSAAGSVDWQTFSRIPGSREAEHGANWLETRSWFGVQLWKVRNEPLPSIAKWLKDHVRVAIRMEPMELLHWLYQRIELS